MPQRRKPKLLNVRKHIEWTEKFCEILREAHDKGQASIPPAYLDALNELRFISKCILRKHATHNAQTGQRKDIRVNV